MQNHLTGLNTFIESSLGADYMSRAGSVEGLALSAEMTVRPGIACGGPARLRLNLEAVV